MRRSHEGLRGIKKDNYPGLPEELREFNYYYDDGETGHVIMAVPKCILEEAEKRGDLDLYECPFPVKYVLENGYRIYKNHVICEGNYGEFGLEIDEKWYEVINNRNNIKENIFTSYEVGKIYNEVIGHAEGAYFDLTDSGAILKVYFNNPDFDEIAQFKQGTSFEIRYKQIYDVIMLTFKIGNLNWLEAPYTPHLSKNLQKYTFPSEGKGLGLTLMLFDTQTGELKNLRLLGLSTDFTKKIFGSIMNLKMQDFDIDKYKANLNKIFNTYATKDIVKISNVYFRIN